MRRAGRLRHRVSIQSPTEVRDSFGGVTLAWATAATVWGRVENVGGSEQWAGDTVRAGGSGTVTIRYYAGLTVRMRFLFGTRVLNITDIDNDPVNRQMVCTYMEDVNP